jgi:hypothetical protein
VDVRIFGGEPGQRDTKFERVLKIRWTLTARPGKHKVKCGDCPRRLDQCLHLGEESRRQPGDWIADSRQLSEKLVKQAGLLSGYANPLAVDRIVAANCVGDGYNPAGEWIEPFEVSPHAFHGSRSAQLRQAAQRD